MKRIIFIGSVICLLYCSCSNRADFDEQYKKILYIVNSKEKLYYAQHEASSQSQGNISIYCTGSKLPNEDVCVSYIVDKEALDAYNKNEYGDQTNLYFQEIPADLITISNQEIVVKKGEEYGCLNFTLNTQKFAPDKVYVLPITISRVPEGYEISEDMHTILYAVNIQNEYAGDYSCSYDKDGVYQGVIRKKVQAMAARQILLPLAGNSNFSITNDLNFNTDYYQITLNEDNSITVSPYLQSVIHPDPDQNSYYDPQEKIFYIHYFIEDKYGNHIQIDEVLSKI